MTVTEQTSTTPRPAAALRRSLLENLESRQLMAASLSMGFQFQPGGVGTPAGLTPDFGKSFGGQYGKQYGWNKDNRGNAVSRNTNADNEHDSFQAIGKTATAWEVAVPNGTYSVKIVAGDAGYYDSKYVIKAENTTVVNGAPTSAKRWVEGTATVAVTDGRLTLSTGSGGYNGKINSVRISSTTPVKTTTGASVAPAAPAAASAYDNGTASVTLNWSDNANNEGGFVVARSTDGANFSDIAWLGSGATSYTNTGLNPNTTYYYRVWAYNEYGSTSSPIVSARTDALPVAAAPRTPGGVNAYSKAMSVAMVSWGQVDNETGFIVERSSDGTNFAEVARVGANDLDAEVGGLTYGARYFFRVRAFNNSGVSAPSGAVSVTMPGTAAPTNNTPTNNTPSNDDGINAFAMSGMITSSKISFATNVATLRSLGQTSVRMWYDAGNWSGGPNGGDIDRAMEYKRAGFKVTLDVVGKDVADANTVRAYFDRLQKAVEAKGGVDFWEIGNEPNKADFWHGSLQQYVTQYLKPAYEVLHANGEKVIGGAVTWDVNALKQMMSYGYLNYCDYAGFHPYGESGQIVADRAYAAKAAIGNKPMIVTEWNIRLMTDLNKWASDLNIAARALSKVSYMNYYYAMVVNPAAWSTGKGGVIYDNGARNTPFWNTVYNWTH